MIAQAASHLGISSNPKLREALHEDETRIAAHLLSILDSQTAKEAVLLLEGDSAQHVLDVIQHTLDRGLLIEQEHNAKARRMILKLSEACDKLPSSLFITGVSGRDHDATFGGGFGDIYRASYGGKTVALKRMRMFHRGSELRRIRLQFCREALIWQHFKHPYILPMLGIDRESFPSSLCMVSPWMENGTVLNCLEEHGRQDVDKFLGEVAQGLEYLHSGNIVHGDLRGANILINQDWSACLADFGLTSFTDVTAATTTSHRAGTIRWMAPELIDPDRFGIQFRRTTASDVYAFACVCLELYTGRPPFADIREGGVVLKIVQGERPTRPSTTPPMSDALWNYVNAWWVEDPATRPPAKVIVRNIEMTKPSDHTNGASTTDVPHNSLTFGNVRDSLDLGDSQYPHITVYPTAAMVTQECVAPFRLPPPTAPPSLPPPSSFSPSQFSAFSAFLPAVPRRVAAHHAPTPAPAAPNHAPIRFSLNPSRLLPATSAPQARSIRHRQRVSISDPPRIRPTVLS
ncbi:kinase-like domain-containing protein [Mycena rebaudengoi]|nr:kinase-like domain-containing protein [Mycena rebaudengoi]